MSNSFQLTSESVVMDRWFFNCSLAILAKRDSTDKVVDKRVVTQMSFLGIGAAVIMVDKYLF